MAGLSAPPVNHRLLLTPLLPITTTTSSDDINERACARIFILRELRRLYNLPVGCPSLRGPYVRIVITTWLLTTVVLCDRPLGGGNKNKTKKRERNVDRSGTPREVDCVTEVDAPLYSILGFHAEWNWAKRASDDRRNIPEMIMYYYEHVIYFTL